MTETEVPGELVADGMVRTVRSALVDVLAPIEPEVARRLSNTPVNRANGYVCLTRAAIGALGGLLVRHPRDRAQLAREALDVFRTSISAALAAGPDGMSRDDIEWFVALIKRMRVLAARAGGKQDGSGDSEGLAREQSLEGGQGRRSGG